MKCKYKSLRYPLTAQPFNWKFELTCNRQKKIKLDGYFIKKMVKICSCRLATESADSVVVLIWGQNCFKSNKTNRNILKQIFDLLFKKKSNHLNHNRKALITN